VGSKLRASSPVIALVLVLVGAMLVAPASAGKKKRVERVDEREYILATGPRGAADTPCVAAPIGCVIFPLEKGDKFVDVEVIDDAGEPVWASVYVYGYTDGSDTHEHICGESEAPLKLAPDMEELVVVTTQTTGGATSPCTGPATQGTIKVTFSNLP